MKNFLKYFFMLTIGLPGMAFSQNTAVPFSSVNTGFELSPSPGTTVTSIVGQTVVEDAQQLNTHVESGFLVYSRISPSAVQVIPASDSVAAEGQQFEITFPISPNVVTFAESLYYRRGGEHVYVGDTLRRDPDTLRGSIPASYATIRGIEYYIIFRVSGASVFIVTYPNVNPVDVPAVIPVAVDDTVYPVALKRITYSMVSVPLDLETSRRDIFSVLGGDYGGTYARNRWRIFRWQQGDYAEYPDISASFTPGTSFWLITQSGKNFTTGSGWSVTTPRGINAYPLVLEPGWNQIATPFAYPVSWTNILQGLGLDSLVSLPNYYNGTEYEVTDILRPWEGYFVFNAVNQPITLFVNPKEFPAGLLPPSAMNDRHKPEASYALDLTAEIPELKLKDSHNILGFWKETTPASKRINDPEPPPIGDYVRLSVTEKGRDFMSMLTALPGDGQSWDIELYATSPNRVAHVTFSEFGQLPTGFQRYVLDKDNVNVIPSTDERFSVQLGEAFTKRSLKVIIGTKEYAEQQSGGISLVPLSYALEQNFPNPFNPETKIRYQLSKRSTVRLEIFNILGQRVKTLVDAAQLTGVYTVLWDGNNDAGTPVATGMYMYRLHAEDMTKTKGAGFVANRKLLLIR